MLRFSPCLDIFFKDLPFERRVAKAAHLGYSCFEFWTWWDKDLGKLREAISASGIRCAAMCTKFVSLTDASERARYIAGLRETLDVVNATDTPIIISQVGNDLEGIPRGTQKRSIVDGLRASAELLEKTGRAIAIEPLNIRYDHTGYFLARMDETAEIVNAVGSDRIGILFDIYHQQITEGNLINSIVDYFPLIRHFHVADVPGRHEIGTGEINYFNVLSRIEELGYAGSVGIELFPLDKSHEHVLRNPLFVGEEGKKGP
jgi:hydroxypyruvate isomerase